MARELTAFDLNAIAETEAAMAIEGMPMDEAGHQMLVDYATGAKTEEQILSDIEADAMESEASA